MPEKRRTFPRTRFSAEVVAEAVRAASAILGGEGPENAIDWSFHVLKVSHSDLESWSFDTFEEFYVEYAKPSVRHMSLSLSAGGRMQVGVYFGDETECDTNVAVSSLSRAEVERIMLPFEQAAIASALPPPAISTAIFVGHGHSGDWRELYEHLRDQHRMDVQSFETHPRAGYTAKEVLERITAETSFAILVHTAEDEQADSTLRARENVIHETGLFQGRLGFARAIIVREEGCEAFSNVAGLQEIRYSPGAIREAFGDVLAVLRREFG